MSLFLIEAEDLPMYLAMAKRIVADGAILTTDPFLYSIPNYAWTIAHQWLSYLVFYTAYLLGDWTAVTLLKALVVLCLPTLSLWLAWRRGNLSSITFLILSVALSASLWRLVERSALFSDLLLCLVLFLLLEEQRKHSWKIFVLPLIFLLWVNLHPGFLTGLVLVLSSVIFRISERHTSAWKSLAMSVGLSILATLINPRGLDGVLYPLQFASNEALIMQKYYTEWFPLYHPSFLGSFIFCEVVFLILVTLALLIFWVSQKRFLMFEWIAFLLISAMVIQGIRFIPLAMFSLSLLIVSMLPLQCDRWRKINFAFAAAFLAMIISVCVQGYSTLNKNRTISFGLSPAAFPIANVEKLGSYPLEWNLFNNHDFGGYIAWRWDGARKVHYHGFVTDLDFYLNNFIRIVRSPQDFQDVVQKFDLRIILVDKNMGYPVFQPLISKFPEWQLDGVDEMSVMWIRK